MDDDTALGSVLPGLDGFTLRGTGEIDGQVQLMVQTTTARTGCPDLSMAK